MQLNTTRPLLIIGIMTGNSMDAVDTVLTAFYPNGDIKDLVFNSTPYPNSLYQALQHLRQAIADCGGDMERIATHYRAPDDGIDFSTVLLHYMEHIAAGIEALMTEAAPILATFEDKPPTVDLIGFHGQTCAHQPGSTGAAQTYTVQIGDGQWLANRTGIPTVFDFRSDDLMAKGEGAPLMPTHHRHLARALKRQRALPMTLINAGNTSNITHLLLDSKKQLITLGWDAGPCNHFPDALIRQEKGLPFDLDGQQGKKGKVNLALLRQLFNEAVCTANDQNFLLKMPPKSSDPIWYSDHPFKNCHLTFANQLRTAEYFSAYLTFHSLSHTPDHYDLPHRFTIFGGGWKNKIIFKHFKGLLNGHFDQQPILPEHRACFERLHQRIAASGEIMIASSDDYGISADAMEARLIADMARCRIIGVPYTSPAITGCQSPQICGVIAYPQQDKTFATETLQRWQTLSNEQIAKPVLTAETRWSRAALGWQTYGATNLQQDTVA